MSHTCPPGTYSDAALQNGLMHLYAMKLDDLQSEGIDIMVKRLFAELNRQLCQVESKKDGELKAGERMENARVLASLQHTLERLARMEAQREAYRKGKNVAKDADARKALERKLDQLAAARGSNDNSERSQR
ncbi:MAG: hypothetical protein ACTHLR_11835 [Rhizomicrobium sp.]